jgi:hypothetical protein
MPQASYSDRQLKTLEVLQRARMAWIAFWFVLVLLTAILLLLVYCVFWTSVDTWVKVALALIDGSLGLSFRRIVGFLFPHVTATRTSRE